MFTIKNSHLDVLALFTDGYNKSLHIREVARLLKISPRTSMILLDDLAKANILTFSIQGKNKSYQLNRNQITEYYLALAESYKKARFLDKNPVFSTIASKLKADIAFIFGSYAKSIEKRSSDLDIFIAGDYNKLEMSNLSKSLSIKLDIKQYPKDAFNNPDILVKQVIKNHIILEGQEKFVKSALALRFPLD